MLGMHFAGKVLVIEQRNGSTNVLFQNSQPVAFSIVQGTVALRFKKQHSTIKGWRDAEKLDDQTFDNKLRSAMRIAVAG